MANIIVQSGGTQGPRGNSVLNGVGAPVNNVTGIDGDFYLDTTNLSVIYGPRANGIWPAPQPFTVIKSNPTATTNPTASNDSSQGYVVGSFWVNTTTNTYFVASKVTVNNAVWTPALPVGTTANTVAAGNDSRIINSLQVGNSAFGDLSGAWPSPTVVNTHLVAPLPLSQGGTGSIIQNFVDLSQAQTIAGAKTFTGEVLVPTPVNGADATNKTYVDSIAAGLSVKTSVVAATTGALPANTYNNGASGVGATLTGNATGTLTIDGHLVALNDRVLIKNEATQQNNGIYLCTTAGAVGVAYVLTRSTDMDQNAEITSAFTFVSGGSVNLDTGWIVTGSASYIIGTTPIVWSQFSGAGTVTAGTGINITGNVVSLQTPVAQGNLPAGGVGVSGIVAIDGVATDIKALGTQAAGSTGLAADAGHVHPTTGLVLQSAAATTVVSETSYGQAATQGVDLTYAREDHTHGSPSLTNAAPATTEGIGQSAAVGTATTPARADHVHPLAAAGAPHASAVGDAQATGVATTFAASDHVHAREGFGSVTALSSFGTSSANGTATTVSHSDHVHGAPALPAATLSSEGIVQLAGDLGGTAASPSVLKINGVTINGTPTDGQSILAVSGTQAKWTTPFYASTGTQTGGIMTVNGTNPSAFDITQANCVIADYQTSPANPTLTPVVVPAQTVVISGAALTRDLNYWFADATGTIFSQATPLTPDQRRQNIALGATGSVIGTGVIFDITTTPVQVVQPVNFIYDFLNALGPFNITGNVITANGANLSINKSAGTAFAAGTNYAVDPRNPSIRTNNAEVPVTLRYVTQIANSAGSPVTVVDPTHYDVGGTVTLVGGNSNSATIQRIWLIPGAATGAQIFVQYGQTVYSSLSAATAAIGTNANYIVDPNFTGISVLLAHLAMTRTCTDLTNAASASLVIAQRFAIP